MNCSVCTQELTRVKVNTQYDALICNNWRCRIHHQHQQLIDLLSEAQPSRQLGSFQDRQVILGRQNQQKRRYTPRNPTTADSVNNQRKKNNYAALVKAGHSPAVAQKNMSDKKARALLGEQWAPA